MNKRDALRLSVGEWVAFGNSARTADVLAWRRGQVVHVTPKGGIKVRTASGEEWIPYHHVWPGLDASNPHFGKSGTTRAW